MQAIMTDAYNLPVLPFTCGQVNEREEDQINVSLQLTDRQLFL